MHYGKSKKLDSNTKNTFFLSLRFNKIAFNAVRESTFQRLKHLQVLDIEGNFEFSDPLKEGDHSEEEVEEEEEEEEQEVGGKRR